MSDISGGSISFKSELDNQQINSAIEETLRRVQGLTDATVSGGAAMDGAFGATADSIRDALGQIGEACEVHEMALHDLEMQYEELGRQSAEAFMAGRDEEMARIDATRAAVDGEIKTRRSLIKELQKQSDKLEEMAGKMEAGNAVEETAAQKHVSLRARLRELREALVEMEAAGQRGTAEYAALREEAAQLTDAWSDATAQANILAHDQKGMQGIMSGLTGMSGAFSAAQGAVALFSGENENLQKIMLKVQSLMAVTVGLQQVQQTLNKDSAFRLVVVNGLKEWWAKITKQQTAAATQNTAAVTGNTAATVANAAAATAGSAANKGLAASFRVVGAAIKSIPVFGWIAAGIAAIITAITLMNRKSREARKEAEEFSKSMVDACYKPIGNIEQLSVKWAALGDDIDAKTKFIRDNIKAFEDLGVAINGVTDAENLLNANKDKFIQSQIEKAKAAVYIEQNNEKIKEMLKLEQEIAAMPDQVQVNLPDGPMSPMRTRTVNNTEKDRKKEELLDLKETIKRGYTDAAAAEAESIRLLEEAGIEAAGKFGEGTVGAIEQQISDIQASIKKMSDPTLIAKANAKIKKLQKSLTTMTGQGNEKEIFKAGLDKIKAEYQRFFKYVNSGDQILVQSAENEFAGLVARGATYLDYLEGQRDQIMQTASESRTKNQTENLRTINDAIAEETKRTVLDSFNKELSDQLTNAKTIVEILKVIEAKRNALANDGTEIDNEKKRILDESRENAINDAAKQTQALLEEYAGYVEKKRLIEEQFAQDMALLERRLATETNRQSIDAINDAIRNRTSKKDSDIAALNPDNSGYKQLLQEYGTYTQRRYEIELEFEDKRKIARENNDTELLNAIAKAEKEAISKLATETFTKSDVFSKIFSTINENSLKEIDNLIEQINKRSIDVTADMSDQDIADVTTKLKELREQVASKNPFTLLELSMKEMKEGADEASFAHLTAALSELQGYYDNIVGAIADIANYTGSATLKEIAEIAGDIGDVASAIVTGASQGGWIGAIVNGLIALIPIIIKWASGLRRVEKENAVILEQVDRLAFSYQRLQDSMEGVYGDQRYSQVAGLVSNLREQNEQLRQAIANMQELDSDKQDTAAIDDWTEQIYNNEQKMKELLQSVREELTGTDTLSIAKELGDAIFNAFAQGEDAAKAWGDTVNDVVKKIVQNMLIQTLVAKKIQPLFDAFTESLIDSDGNWVSEADMLQAVEVFAAALDQEGEGLISVLEALRDQYPDWFAGDAATSLSGAVKGVTEETASIVAGQMNAMRINQVESIAIMRNQLQAIYSIEHNTSVACSKLESIHSFLVSNLNGRALGLN